MAIQNDAIERDPSSVSVHGPDRHTDQSRLVQVPGYKFSNLAGGVWGIALDFPRWRLDDLTDVRIATFMELPDNFVVGQSFTVYDWLIGVSGGVALSGNGRFGTAVVPVKNLDALSTSTPSLITEPMPATAINTMRRYPLATPVSAVLETGDIGVKVVIRRDGSDILDTIGQSLDFYGVVVGVVLDE